MWVVSQRFPGRRHASRLSQPRVFIGWRMCQACPQRFRETTPVLPDIAGRRGSAHGFPLWRFRPSVPPPPPFAAWPRSPKAAHNERARHGRRFLERSEVIINSVYRIRRQPTSRSRDRPQRGTAQNILGCQSAFPLELHFQLPRPFNVRFPPQRCCFVIVPTLAISHLGLELRQLRLCCF